MTQYHFISSPKLLKEGTFGDNPVSPEKPNVYATNLDFDHLFIKGNWDKERKVIASYSEHFKYKYQVGFISGQIPIKGRGGKLNSPRVKKYLDILYKYIVDAVNDSGVIEYYTSWNSEEDLPISGMRQISLANLKFPEDLVIADRELVTIVA